MSVIKPIEFRGSSLDDLRGFPQPARQRIGQQLDKVQHGADPVDWKPMKIVGSGVREIRVRDETGIFRAMYVAKFSSVIYVLHCFQKKTEKTSEKDIDLAKSRYLDLQKELS